MPFYEMLRNPLLTRWCVDGFQILGVDFIPIVEDLLKLLARDIVLRGNTKLSLMRPTNRYLASFLRDLFMILPYSDVVELIRVYCSQVSAFGTAHMAF